MNFQHMFDFQISLLFRDWQCRHNVIYFWDLRIPPKSHQGNCTRFYLNPSNRLVCSFSYRCVSWWGYIFPNPALYHQANPSLLRVQGLKSCLTHSCRHCLRFWLLPWGIRSRFIGLSEQGRCHPTFFVGSLWWSYLLTAFSSVFPDQLPLLLLSVI